MFEKFVEKNRSFSTKASISKSGNIGINDAARTKYKLDEYNYCYLYYDREEKKVGIEFTNEQSDECIKIRRRKTGIDIGAKAFVGYYEIELEGTTMYGIDTIEGKPNWLVLNLNKGRIRKTKKI